MIVWLGAPFAALLTTTSSRPKCSTARSTSRRHCATSPVSVGTASACTPSRLELADDLVEVVGPPGRDHDVAAVARERERGRTADAGTDPGDDREPPVAAHGRAAPKSSAMRPSRRASSVSSSAFQPARASEAAATDAARSRR